MSHTMTITDSIPSFTCTNGPEAACHSYPACDCDEWTEDHAREHPNVQHEKCVLDSWYSISTDATQDMYLEGDDPMPENATGEIETEWDECPLWYFLNAPESHDSSTTEGEQ